MKRNIQKDAGGLTTGLRAALEASGVVGIWDWNILGQTVRYDHGAASLLAGDASLAGKDLRRSVAMARIHPADVGWLVDKTRHALEAGNLYLAEYRVVAENGGDRWLPSRGRFDLDHARRPVRARGILIDITESRDFGQGYVSVPHLGAGDPVDEVASYCLAAQQSLQADGTPMLRMLMNTVLLELGHEIARRMRRRTGH